MQEPRLRELANEYLVPLVASSRIEGEGQLAGPGMKNTAFLNPQRIAFRLAKTDHFRLVLTRNQIFDKRGEGRISELTLVRAFTEALADVEQALDKPYGATLLAGLQSAIVAKSVAGYALESTVVRVVNALEAWAARLYEGGRISAAIGIDGTAIGAGVTLEQIIREDFAAVLSNGFDTLLVVNGQAEVVGYRCLDSDSLASTNAPLRQSAVAEWANDGKVAVALNRLGELMVFANGQLVFSRRSGRWYFLTHEPVITQLLKPKNNRELRRAVYQTCLDVSFARTGGCIGVVLNEFVRKSAWHDLVPRVDDRMKSTSIKARTITSGTQARAFQHLDRRTRAELLAIDGATLLDQEGQFLAVGAILKIPGGSTGGGRRAAAIALSRMGLGIKISQDGAIAAFIGGQPDPAVAVM